uniref:Uncharacterized protein n=1 Tax=Nelumbo nucifera TaxID=4432 RepID=A0A822Z089_NELNU|nr:TPA_asm: hypothetical protein HUJ06_008821 [Nelumbo nucifera]
MFKLVSVIRCIGRWRRSLVLPLATSLSDVDVELVGVFRDVNDVTVSISISLFNRMISSSSSFRCFSFLGFRLGVWDTTDSQRLTRFPLLPPAVPL